MEQHKQHTIFVSGHLDLTIEEFKTNYLPLVGGYVFSTSWRYNFIVGDAPGADTMFQLLMKTINLSDSVTVCHMFEKPKNHLCGKLVGGFTSDEERDSYMTANSYKDLAWVRPGREQSGTAKNLARRLNANQLLART